jgi:hypothetical protein
MRKAIICLTTRYAQQVVEPEAAKRVSYASISVRRGPGQLDRYAAQ